MSNFPGTFEGLLDLLVENIKYITGATPTTWLDGGNASTDEGRFWCLVARNDTVTITTQTITTDGVAIPFEIVLGPGNPPVYGDFRKVVIDAGSPGVLQVHSRPSKL